MESTGKPPTEVFVCGKRIDLNTEDGKQQYSEQLEAVLTEVKCRLTSQAENFRFIIGDGVKLLGVQSNANNFYVPVRKPTAGSHDFFRKHLPNVQNYGIIKIREK